MKVLALETATIEVGAAIVAERATRGQVDVLASRRVRSGRLQAETLHPLIVEVLEESKVQLDEIDVIAVDKGPGLFTGLRVGIAAAKALAFGCDLPLVGCTSTEILFAGATGTNQPVLAIVDMRRGEVAYARSDHPAEPVLCRPEECAAMIAADDSLVGALVVGDGAVRYRELFEPVIALRNIVIGDDQHRAADPGVLGRLAVAAMHEQSYVSAAEISPLYLREADAKINWTTRDLTQVIATQVIAP